MEFQVEMRESITARERKGQGQEMCPSVSQKPAPLKVGFKLPGCSNWRVKRHISLGPCEPGSSIWPDRARGRGKAL